MSHWSWFPAQHRFGDEPWYILLRDGVPVADLYLKGEGDEGWGGGEVATRWVSSYVGVELPDVVRCGHLLIALQPLPAVMPPYQPWAFGAAVAGGDL